MKVRELKGSKIKRELKKRDINIVRVVKRYHNKHKDGSGNFGFTIVTNPTGNTEKDKWGRFKYEKWHSLDGEYNTDEEIFVLRFGSFSGAGEDVGCVSFDDMIRGIEKIIKREEEVLK